MSFRDEVNAVAKTPDQVEAERRSESVNGGVNIARQDYNNLKAVIKRKAQNGEYEIVNGKRMICFDFADGHIRYLINYQHTWFDGICEKGVDCVANDSVLVEAYKKELYRLAKEDDISVQVKCAFTDHDGTKLYFDVPGTEFALRQRNTVHIKGHSKIVLQCSFVL